MRQSATLQKSHLTFLTDAHRNLGNTCEMETKTGGNGGRNIELDQDEFIDMNSLSRDPAFNVPAQEVRKGYNNLIICLTESSTKRWPIMKLGNARPALV